MNENTVHYYLILKGLDFMTEQIFNREIRYKILCEILTVDEITNSQLFNKLQEDGLVVSRPSFLDNIRYLEKEGFITVKEGRNCLVINKGENYDVFKELI